jgi:hypothetical protein
MRQPLSKWESAANTTSSAGTGTCVVCEWVSPSGTFVTATSLAASGDALPTKIAPGCYRLASGKTLVITMDGAVAAAAGLTPAPTSSCLVDFGSLNHLVALHPTHVQGLVSCLKDEFPTWLRSVPDARTLTGADLVDGARVCRTVVLGKLVPGYGESVAARLQDKSLLWSRESVGMSPLNACSGWREVT